MKRAGTHIECNNANFYASFDLFEKMFGKLGNTTPVGFFNGNTYDVYPGFLSIGSVL